MVDMEVVVVMAVAVAVEDTVADMEEVINITVTKQSTKRHTNSILTTVESELVIQMRLKATTSDIPSSSNIDGLVVEEVEVEVAHLEEEAAEFKTRWTIKQWELSIHTHTSTSIGIGRLEVISTYN